MLSHTYPYGVPKNRWQKSLFFIFSINESSILYVFKICGFINVSHKNSFISYNLPSFISNALYKGDASPEFCGIETFTENSCRRQDEYINKKMRQNIKCVLYILLKLIKNPEFSGLVKGYIWFFQIRLSPIQKDIALTHPK